MRSRFLTTARSAGACTGDYSRTDRQRGGYSVLAVSLQVRGGGRGSRPRCITHGEPECPDKRTLDRTNGARDIAVSRRAVQRPAAPRHARCKPSVACTRVDSLDAHMCMCAHMETRARAYASARMRAHACTCVHTCACSSWEITGSVLRVAAMRCCLLLACCGPAACLCYPLAAQPATCFAAWAHWDT